MHGHGPTRHDVPHGRRWRHLRVLSLYLLLLIVLASPALANPMSPVPIAPAQAAACPVGQFRAEYFANVTLSGSPTVIRCEAAPLANNWGGGTPDPRLPSDNFSVRYVGRFPFDAGDYTFTTTVDDGVRAWLNGTLLIDDAAGTPGTYTATRNFPPGVSGAEHELKLEYFERGGAARLGFAWQKGLAAPPTATPLPTATPGGTSTPTTTVPPTACEPTLAMLKTGFCLTDFATGLTGVRLMAYGPDGDLYASLPSQGRIVRLPDRDHDGRADSVQTFVSGLNQPHGLAFLDGYLYVAETDALTRVKDTNGDGVAEQVTRLATLPGGGGHSTRTVIVGSDRKLYVSIGSSCDACVEGDARRAAVMQFNPDGSGGIVYAKGLRNAVGLVRQPSSGTLWGIGNERDGLGDNLPGDPLVRLTDGTDFGWPRCINGAAPDTRFAGGCSGVTPPVLTFQAHSAPLSGTFYTGTAFPAEYRGDLFVAFHGSWNRSQRTGYKLVRVRFSGDQPTGQVEDVASWLDQNQNVLGRPVDVIMAPDGALLVSDDNAHRIYRIRPR